MSNIIKPLGGFLLFLLLIISCKKPSDQKELTKAVMNSLQLEFTSLKDSVAHCWKNMMVDDDEKLFHIKRLLEEVSNTNDYDRVRFDSLMQMHRELVALRYDYQTMADSDLIDEYDTKTSILIREVSDFARSHPKFENYILMEQLIIDINEADNRVLLHRIRYDDFCSKYNDFIDTTRQSLAQFASSNDLKKRALFTLFE